MDVTANFTLLNGEILIKIKYTFFYINLILLSKIHYRYIYIYKSSLLIYI